MYSPICLSIVVRIFLMNFPSLSNGLITEKYARYASFTYPSSTRYLRLASCFFASASYCCCLSIFSTLPRCNSAAWKASWSLNAMTVLCVEPFPCWLEYCIAFITFQNEYPFILEIAPLLNIATASTKPVTFWNFLPMNSGHLNPSYPAMSIARYKHACSKSTNPVRLLGFALSNIYGASGHC